MTYDIFKGILKVLIFWNLFFVLFVSTISASEDNFRFIQFYDDNESETDKVIYSLRDENFLEEGDLFVLEYRKDSFDDNSEEGGFERICSKRLSLDSNSIFRKLICEVNKIEGDVRVVFVAKIITEDGRVKGEIFNEVFFLDEGLRVVSKYENLEDRLNVDLFVDGKNILDFDKKEFMVLVEIPKSVIEILDEENKGEFVVSNRDFVILKEDPLIGWNIEQVPSKINYTIQKKVRSEDVKKFKVGVVSKESASFFNFVFFILILVIIGLIFYPFIKKKLWGKKRGR